MNILNFENHNVKELISELNNIEEITFDEFKNRVEAEIDNVSLFNNKEKEIIRKYFPGIVSEYKLDNHLHFYINYAPDIDVRKGDDNYYYICMSSNKDTQYTTHKYSDINYLCLKIDQIDELNSILKVISELLSIDKNILCDYVKNKKR